MSDTIALIYVSTPTFAPGIGRLEAGAELDLHPRNLESPRWSCKPSELDKLTKPQLERLAAATGADAGSKPTKNDLVEALTKITTARFEAAPDDTADATPAPDTNEEN